MTSQPRVTNFLLSALISALSALVLLFSGCASAQDRQLIKIGYAHGIELNIEQKTFLPTLDYLQAKLPQYRFELEQISPVDTIEEIKSEGLSFFLAPSNFYIEIGREIPLTHIVSRRNSKAGALGKSVGSVFVVRSDRTDINTLADLKNKKCAATQNNSLSGWLAAQGEIKRNGFHPEKFFSRVSFLQYQTPDVLNAVLSGASDVGILSTCTLENAVSEGLIEKKSLKVINPQSNPDEPSNCVRSTFELYPDIVFVAVKGTPESIIRDVAVTLLSMPAFGPYHWSFEDDYYAVNKLLRELEIGPYAYLRDMSPTALFHRFRTEIIASFLLLIFLILNEVRLHFLVNRRTSQLKNALKEKTEADEMIRKERKKFSILEKNGLIAQMSSILAHEAKQPISSLVNYLEILRMRLEQENIHDPLTAQAIQNADQQVSRLNALVDSVRNFATKKQNPLIRCDLAEITRKAIRSYERNEPESEMVRIEFRTDTQTAWINADPFSMELLILNLLRNGAQEALEYTVKGKPLVSVRLESDHPQRLILRVENSGRQMTDEEMERLISLGESVKTQGLGLGLSIIRSIADQHSADLKFEKRPGGGVIADLVIDRYGETT